MYIKVKLLNGYKQELTYKVPVGWDTSTLQGAIVNVPIRNIICPAVVVETLDVIQHATPYTIREAYSREDIPHDDHYQKFIKQLSEYYQIDQSYFSKRLKQFVSQKETDAPDKKVHQHSPTSITLTNEQQHIIDNCIPIIDKPTYKPIVIHGVTGSGKTEVYKKLIEHTLKLNKSVILLLPEVTLAVVFQQLLESSMPGCSIFGFHSATSVKEKKLLWQTLRSKKPMLIIGVHLPILLPIPDLGLIIIDEEHEVGFQEKKHPKINSKEAALYRANIAGIPIILGSATPSIATLYNVQTKQWPLFKLTQRFGGAFPRMQVASLTDKKQRKHFWISTQLYQAVQKQLKNKEQTIIFINRRGYSFFVQCKQCSFIFQCPDCSVSLTLHAHNQLQCHYCGHSRTQPSTCPQCSQTDSFIKKGIGTQQVVEILQTLFPQARIARADLDTTVNKKKWQQTLHAMEQRDIDILVGTQTITKGYHFPHVTLVGILWADLNLNFPMFNASETTLAQLLQVAGRAGRASSESMVIVQTMMDHPIFNHLNEQDFMAFYDAEIQHRKQLGYPPCKRFVEIELKHTNPAILDTEAQQCTDSLIDIAFKIDPSILVLGPAKPPVYKIQNSYRFKIYLKGPNIHTLIQTYTSLDKTSYTSALFFTPNPLTI